jgi:hypothetical protein
MMILKENASFLVAFKRAPLNIDLNEVGDIVLESNIGHIAFRARRPEVEYRDLTIRSRRASGAETELAKIRKGFGRWYLYCWADGEPYTNGNGKIKNWILVDLDQFRGCGLAYENRPDKPNPDRMTWFIPYNVDELDRHQCIVAMDNDLMKRHDFESGLLKLDNSEIAKPNIKPPETAYEEYIAEQLALFTVSEDYAEAAVHDQFHKAYYDD